ASCFDTQRYRFVSAQAESPSGTFPGSGAACASRRQNGSATSTITTPAAPAATNAQDGPYRSMTLPAIGAEIAPPISSAVPCRPIASPRAPAGTQRVRVSTVDESAGAQSSPDGSSASTSHHQPPETSATGTVSNPTAAISASGENPRDSIPYRNPPASE